MKKSLLLFVGLFAIASIASAQKVETITVSKLGYSEKKEIERVDLKQTMPLSRENAPALSSKEGVAFNSSKAPAALTASYYRPAGTLLGGVDTDGRGYLPLFAGHGNVEWKFKNQSKDYNSIEWYIPTSESNYPLTVDAQGNGLFNPEYISSFQMPRVKVKSGTVEDTYYYGKEAVEDPQTSYQYAVAVAGEELILTPADLIQGQLYLGFKDGYGYGSGTSNDANIRAVGEFFEKPQAPLFARSIGVFLYSDNNIPLTGSAKLTGSVYKVKYKEDGSDNYRRLGDLMHSADVYADELINAWTYSSGEKVYFARFTFEEYDEESGFVTPVDLVLDDEFAFVIEGLDQEGVNCGFSFSKNFEVEGSAYVYLDNDHFTWFIRSQTDESNAYDITVMIEGAYTTLIVDEMTKKLTAPDAGGDAYFTYQGQNYKNAMVMSTYNSDEVWCQDIPDWLELTVENEQYEQYRLLDCFLTAQPLPAGVTGRWANVVLASYGTTATIQVVQGDAVPTDISSPNTENVFKAVRQGDNFQLSYPAAATSVSVYNLTGQRVAEYKLNVTGTYTLPAANLANGVYVLKFNGTNTAVKILK
jgi:hypothetical protein